MCLYDNIYNNKSVYKRIVIVQKIQVFYEIYENIEECR